jgi:Zn-finger nucleic acid-binding protein
MVARTIHLTCPECHEALVHDQTRLNIQVDTCPNGHGIFLDREDLEHLVGVATRRRLRELARASTRAAGSCPHCHGALKDFDVLMVPARGCEDCGSIWFASLDLRNHVHGVRRRAYGQGSMAARTDVMRDATAFYPVEVVAGILTEFELDYPD